MKLKSVLFLSAVLFSIGAKAQNIEERSAAWFLLLNNYKLNDKWSVGNEFHFRQTNFMATREQIILRPYITYTDKSQVQYTVGYSYLSTNPYKNRINHIIPEHNFWEQVTLNQEANKLKISHRFRLEHRFTGLLGTRGGDIVVDDYRFSNRFRYRLTLRRNLGEKLFAILFDELWINMPNGLMPQSVDRNWVFAGLGYNISPKANVQLAYLHQWVVKGGNNFLASPTAQLVFQYDF